MSGMTLKEMVQMFVSEAVEPAVYKLLDIHAFYINKARTEHSVTVTLAGIGIVVLDRHQNKYIVKWNSVQAAEMAKAGLRLPNGLKAAAKALNENFID